VEIYGNTITFVRSGQPDVVLTVGGTFTVDAMAGVGPPAPTLGGAGSIYVDVSDPNSPQLYYKD
jgi:hypothetical protein